MTPTTLGARARTRSTADKADRRCRTLPLGPRSARMGAVADREGEGVFGDQLARRVCVVDRECDDIDVKLGEALVCSLERSQLGVAVRTPRAAQVQDSPKVQSERARRLDGRSVGRRDRGGGELVVWLQRGHRRPARWVEDCGAGCKAGVAFWSGKRPHPSCSDARRGRGSVSVDLASGVLVVCGVDSPMESSAQLCSRRATTHRVAGRPVPPRPV